jgi:vancomycin permeability regulator SanA
MKGSTGETALEKESVSLWIVSEQFHCPLAIPLCKRGGLQFALAMRKLNL